MIAFRYFLLAYILNQVLCHSIPVIATNEIIVNVENGPKSVIPIPMTQEDDHGHEEDGHEEDGHEEDEGHEERDRYIIQVSSIPSLAILTPLQIAALALFWRRRERFPLNIRMPFHVILTGLVNLCWFALTASFLLVHEVVSCFPRYIVMMLFAPFCGNAIITRFVSLVLRFEIANEQLKVSKAANGSLKSEGKSSIGAFLLANRWVLDQRTMVLANLVLNILFSVIVLLINISTDRQNAELHHIVCNPKYIAPFWTAYLLTLIVVFGALAFRIRKFTDGYYLKKELLILLFLTVVPVAFVLVFVLFDEKLMILVFETFEVPWLEIIIQVYCASATLVITLFPISKSYSNDAVKTNSSISKSATNSSSRQSHHTDEETQLKDLLDPKISKEKKLLLIVKTEILCASFETFLVSEFSHENIKFYKEIEMYEKKQQSLTLQERKFEAMRIYNLYLKPKSFLQVNIDGSDLEIIESKLNSDPELLDIFESVKDHIFQLMTRDSLRRYLASKSFSDAYAKLKQDL